MYFERMVGMNFGDIVGQQNVIRSIKSSIANKRVAHAYLFCGPDGVGKSLVAKVLAYALNCKVKDSEPCGICSSCMKGESGNHPDIISVRTEKASISVDDIRDLQVNMQKKPYEGELKVYIIYEADKMTEQAQNALLKTLEEPPGHVVIVMLTVSQYELLNTVISRCQVVKFTTTSEKAIEDYLVNKRGVGEKEARYIAAFSGGIMKRALEFLDDDSVKKDRDEIIKLISELYKKDKLYALMQADYFTGNKDRIDYILEIMVSWFRDILIYKECEDLRYLINQDKEQIILEDSKRFTVGSLMSIIEIIKQTADNIRSNVNYQLSIETMLLKIQEG